MSRARRHDTILRLLGQSPARSQAALRLRLAEQGFEVTQATLSRDLHELRVAKTAGGYALPDRSDAGDSAVATATDDDAPLRRIIRRELLSANVATSMVVLRVRPGWADAIAVELDRLQFEGIVGSIAGDDTIFLAVRAAADAERVADWLEEISFGSA